jgi:hypothetical protein
MAPPPSLLSGVRYRWHPVTVHGLNPYPLHDLIHVELQVPGFAGTAAEKDALKDALRDWLGDFKHERIWTMSFLGPQEGPSQGWPLPELATLLDEDFF